MRRGTKSGADRQADPHRVDAGDDEEAHDDQVGAVAEEHVGDARRVAGRGQLHDDADDGDDDAEDGGDRPAARLPSAFCIVSASKSKSWASGPRCAWPAVEEVVDQPERRERGDANAASKPSVASERPRGEAMASIVTQPGAAVRARAVRPPTNRRM